jgi:hypothetical protein
MFEDMWEFNVSERLGDREFFRRAARMKDAETVEQLLPPEALVQTAQRRALLAAPRVTWPFWSFPLSFAAIRRDLYTNIGGFDEGLFFCHENTDFALRARQAGYVVGCVRHSFVRHRRLEFRYLRRKEFGDPAGLKPTYEHWDRKWGGQGRELFSRLHYGRWHPIMWPPARVIGRLNSIARNVLWQASLRRTGGSHAL